MENGSNVREKISAGDVISKLKDDGDFDRLRLKIIRKLKENEELRNSIISMVKQSASINRPGAESMKPRQLSDDIHQEVGDKVMNQISDSLWEIIRSHDGMKGEITETVHSVYSKLVNPRGNEEGESSSLNGLVPDQKQDENIVSQTAAPDDMDGMSDNEPTEPPGFSLSNHHGNNHVEKQKDDLVRPTVDDRRPVEENANDPHQSEDAVELGNEDSAPPGFSLVGDSKQPCDGTDDPDLPPGFG